MKGSPRRCNRRRGIFVVDEAVNSDRVSDMETMKMKITLSNLRIYDELSQETLCMTADLLANGEKIATVENDGHGGAPLFRWVSASAAKIIPYIEQEDVMHELLCEAIIA